jgi:hypothetical protein
MKALYFGKVGEPGRSFYRCGVCRQDFSVLVETGVLVKVGTDCMAITCKACFVKARELVSAALPHSFPDLDEAGMLLG